MTEKQFRELGPGDIVKSAFNPDRPYMVTGNYGNRVTAVMIQDMTHADEWILVLKAKHTKV